jgi:hypothetical protein
MKNHRRLRELVAEMVQLRDKFHTEHMLDKAESDRFDALLTEVAEGLEDKYVDSIPPTTA